MFAKQNVDLLSRVLGIYQIQTSVLKIPAVPFWLVCLIRGALEKCIPSGTQLSLAQTWRAAPDPVPGEQKVLLQAHVNISVL